MKPTTWKTVRVFISSTFRDMHAERDHLIKVTFPALREKLLPCRVELFDVDLRWGITEDEAKNEKVIGLCLDQIADCSLFLAFVGHRYGWIPNLVPPETQQRYPFVKQFPGVSVTELELRHNRMLDPSRKLSLILLRNEVAVATIPEVIRNRDFIESAPDLQRQLNDLRTGLGIGPPPAQPYSADWDPKRYDRVTRSEGKLTGLDDFGKQVEEWLLQVIKEKHQLAETPPKVDASQAEADLHERFLEMRTRIYVGRKDVYGRLRDFSLASGESPLLLTGESGLGKSAALACFVRDFRAEYPDVFVLVHFVGASPRTTSLPGMLQRLTHELQQRFILNLPKAVSPDEIIRTFIIAINKLPTSARVVLVLDALNQLDGDSQADSLSWLPERLPLNVRVICSSATGPQKAPRVLTAFGSREYIAVPLQPLTDDERRAILKSVPKLVAKTLDDSQVNALLANPATRNPLFLMVALEELRGYGSFERLNEMVAGLPRDGDTVTKLFDQVFERLEQEFNKSLVDWTLRSLACSRRGLSGPELVELTSSLNEQAEDLYPVLRQLRPYLHIRDGLFDFYHMSIRRAVEIRYLDWHTEEDQRDPWARWNALRQPPASEPTLPESDSRHRLIEFFAKNRLAPRSVDELPWQLSQMRNWQRVADLLGQSKFFEAAWDRAPFEVRELWTLVESQVPGAMVEAYRHVIAAPERHHEIVRDVAMLLALTGNLDEAQMLREYLVREARSTGKPHDISRALLQSANVHWSRGDLQEAMRLLDDAEFIAEENQDAYGLVMVWGNIAAILSARGQWRKAIELFERQKRVCEKVGDMNGLQVAIGGIAGVQSKYGSRSEALELNRERARLCRQVNNLDGLATALVSQSSLLSHLGAAEEAMALCREAEDICRRVRNRERLLSCLARRVQLHLDRGAWESAEEAVNEHESVGKAMGSRTGQVQSLSLRIDIATAKHDWPKALELSDQCLKLCGDIGHAEAADSAQLDKAQILYALGRWRDAAVVHEQAIESARHNDQYRLLARHLSGLAGIRRNHGGLREAAQLWQQAKEIYEQLEDRKGQALTLTHQARLLIDLGRVQESLAPLQQAVLLYREVNDQDGLSDSYGVLGLVYRMLGQSQTALEYLGRQREIAESIKNIAGIRGAMNAEGLVLMDLRRYDEAYERFEECVTMCRAENDLYSLQSNLGNQAIVSTLREDYPTALRLHEEEEKICRQLGDPKNLYLCLIEKAKVLLWLGKVDQALQTYAEAVDTARLLEPPQYLAQALYERAETFLQYKSDRTSACPLIKEAYSIASRLPPNGLLYQIQQALEHCT